MKVVFPYKKKDGKIEYPDNIEYFRNAYQENGNLVADYSGNLSLNEHVPPESEKPQEMKAKEVLKNVSLPELGKSDIGLAVKALLIERGLI